MSESTTDTVAISVLPLEAIVLGQRVMRRRGQSAGAAGVCQHESEARKCVLLCRDSVPLQDVLQGSDIQSLIFSALVSATRERKKAHSAAAALVCTEWRSMLHATFKHVCVSTWSLKLSPDAEALPLHMRTCATHVH
eukprot:3078776-Prymnesium_polylepis.1